MASRGRINFLSTIDKALVSLGLNLGSRIRSDGVRDLTILSGYAGIYLLVGIAPAFIALPMLWLAWFGVIAHSRAWVSNENQRRDIARGLSDLDPDTLPDLRRTSLISALQLVVIIPLLFSMTDRIFDLGQTNEDNSLKEWLLFSIDLLFRSLLDWAEVYEVSLSSIKPTSMSAKHMILLQLLTIDFLLVQAIIRLVETRRMTDEGVRGVSKDPEHAVRLGKRATKALLIALHDTEDDSTKSAIIVALGRIGDLRAAPNLLKMLGQPTVEVDALAALITIDHHPTLTKSVYSSRFEERRAAAIWLARSNHINAPNLISDLSHDSEPTVRREAITAATEHPIELVETCLIRASTDSDTETRRRAVAGLRRHPSEEAMFAAIDASKDLDVEVRLRAVDVLSTHADGRVVQPLAERMLDENKGVKESAKRAIEHLESLQGRS